MNWLNILASIVAVLVVWSSIQAVYDASIEKDFLDNAFNAWLHVTILIILLWAIWK